MIKVALKHWIYERCLDVLFERIQSNFIGFVVNVNNLKIGDSLELIEDKSGRYYNCVIVSIENDNIYFSCERSETLECNFISEIINFWSTKKGDITLLMN
jgi:hypothetical protein